MSNEQSGALPTLYNELTILNSADHGDWRVRPADGGKVLIGRHSIPLNVEEFGVAQRFFPIVFVGTDDIPVALMGLSEGVNLFFDDDEKGAGGIYLPAYVRRYPFLLAKSEATGQRSILCADSSSGIVGDFEDGEPLFDFKGQPTAAALNAVDFCKKFDQAWHRTQGFLDKLNELDLLTDGRLSIRLPDNDTPLLYQGFKIVGVEKLHALSDRTIGDLVRNGMFSAIIAHLLSLHLLSEVFDRQLAQGKGPLENDRPLEKRLSAPFLRKGSPPGL